MRLNPTSALENQQSIYPAAGVKNAGKMPCVPQGRQDFLCHYAL